MSQSAHFAVTFRCIRLQTHTHARNLHCLSYTPHSLSLATHIFTATHTHIHRVTHRHSHMQPISSVKQRIASPRRSVSAWLSYLCTCAPLTAPQTPTCQDAHSGSSQLPTAGGLPGPSQRCSLRLSSLAPVLQDTCLCLIPFPQVTRHWRREIRVESWRTLLKLSACFLLKCYYNVTGEVKFLFLGNKSFLFFSWMCFCVAVPACRSVSRLTSLHSLTVHFGHGWSLQVSVAALWYSLHSLSTSRRPKLFMQ